MTKSFLSILTGATLLFGACATTTTQNVSTVAALVDAGASVAKPYLTAQEVAAISGFKAALGGVASGTLTPVELNNLFAVIKFTSVKGATLQAVLTTAVAGYDLLYANNSSNANAAVVVAYAQGVVVGLSEAGF